MDQIVTLTSGPTALKSGQEENTCPPPIGRITSENQEALLEQLAETEQELSALLKSMKQVRTGTAEHSSLSPVLQENLMTTLYEVTDETRLLNLLEHIDSEDRCLDSMQRELHSTLAAAQDAASHQCGLTSVEEFRSEGSAERDEAWTAATMKSTGTVQQVAIQRDKDREPESPHDPGTQPCHTTSKPTRESLPRAAAALTEVSPVDVPAVQAIPGVYILPQGLTLQIKIL